MVWIESLPLVTCSSLPQEDLMQGMGVCVQGMGNIRGTISDISTYLHYSFQIQSLTFSKV